jgi:hypothetical protein
VKQFTELGLFFSEKSFARTKTIYFHGLVVCGLGNEIADYAPQTCCSELRSLSYADDTVSPHDDVIKYIDTYRSSDLFEAFGNGGIFATGCWIA